MKAVEQLRAAGKLPSPKGVALAIIEVSRDENASVDEIVRVAQTDPALCARLLRLCNAAGNGARPVVAIRDAVMRLGMRVVRQSALTFSMVDQHIGGPCKGFDYDGFWSHSLLMGVAAQALGAECGVAAKEELFSCGLLAQIGRLGLATAYPEQYALVVAGGDAGEALMERERAALQMTHRDLTKAILEESGFPGALGEPIYYHGKPVESGFHEGSRPYQLVNLFHLARKIADLGVASEVDRYGKVSELMLLGGKIGLDAEGFGALFDGVIEQWQDWGRLLKIRAGAPPRFDRISEAPAPRVEGDASGRERVVLLVEDEPMARMRVEAMLRTILGCKVHVAENGREALALAVEVHPHIVVVDWVMPVMDGLELCRALRASSWGESMYVIMLTGVDNEGKIVEAFEAGVDDYIMKPVNARSLDARMRAALHYVKLLEAWEKDRLQLKQFAAELAISNRRFEHAAMTDLLTGLPNRRAGMEALGKAWTLADRSKKPVAVLVADVDHFKAVNDRYGHEVGDRVLQAVGKAMQGVARQNDSVCRLGGEEFLLVCHEADARAAVVVAERLRRCVREVRVESGIGALQVTVSVGVSVWEPTVKDRDTLVRRADQALYAAKHSGRDRVVLWSGEQRRTDLPC